jgi:hypothetical protein
MEIEGQEVGHVREDWAVALMEQGVIVKLTISRWRATSSLRYEELGIAFNDSESQEFMSKYITLGQEKLLPPKVLREITSIEARARRCLAAYSFDTVWGRFVPYSAFTDWKRESDEIREEFFALGKDLGERYDEIVQEVRAEYNVMGADVWRRLYPDDIQPPSASFLQNFTSRIVDKIPNREEIVASFKYETTFFKIPLPSFIQEDIARIENIVLESEMKARDHLRELETKEIIANEYRERKKELIDGFLNSTVDHLRHHIAELADHTYAVLQRNEKDITLTHVKKIKKMIAQVKNLNFYNDEEIHDILNSLDAEVSKYKGERDKKVISTKLRELVNLGKQEYMPKGYNPIINVMDIE